MVWGREGSGFRGSVGSRLSRVARGEVVARLRVVTRQVKQRIPILHHQPQDQVLIVIWGLRCEVQGSGLRV